MTDARGKTEGTGGSDPGFWAFSRPKSFGVAPARHAGRVPWVCRVALRQTICL